jgi:hypothetical protein
MSVVGAGPNEVTDDFPRQELKEVGDVAGGEVQCQAAPSPEESGVWGPGCAHGCPVLWEKLELGHCTN